MRILFILLLFFSTYVFAAIGKISAFKGEVQIKRLGITLIAKKGFKIEKNDIISTSKNARAQMIFDDGTVVSIGKASKLNITDYIFNTTHPKKSTARFNFAKGAFKFITGKIGKLAPEKFKIETKTASIGIRGTVLLGNQQAIACTQGEITVSSNGITQVVPAGMMTQTILGAAPTVPVEYVAGAIDIGGINGNGVTPNNDSEPKDSKQNSEKSSKKDKNSKDKNTKNKDAAGEKKNNTTDGKAQSTESTDNQETQTVDAVTTNTIDSQAPNDNAQNGPEDVFEGDLELQLALESELGFEQMDSEFNAFFDSTVNEFGPSGEPFVDEYTDEFTFAGEFVNTGLIESTVTQNSQSTTHTIVETQGGTTTISTTTVTNDGTVTDTVRSSTASGTTTIATLENAPSYKALSGRTFKAYSDLGYDSINAITSDMKKMNDNSDGTIQAGYYVLDSFNLQNALFSTTLWDFDVATRGAYVPYTHATNQLTGNFNELTGYKNISVLGKGESTTNFANSSWNLAVIGADNTGEFVSIYFQNDSTGVERDALQYKGSTPIMTNVIDGKVYGYRNFMDISAKKTLKNGALRTSRTYYLWDTVNNVYRNTPTIFYNTSTGSLKDLNMLVAMESYKEDSGYDFFRNEDFTIERVKSDGTIESKRYSLVDDYYKTFNNYVSYTSSGSYSKSGSLYGTNLQGIGYTWEDKTTSKIYSTSTYTDNITGTASAYLTDFSTAALSGTAAMSGFAVTNDGVSGDFSFNLNRDSGAISSMSIDTTKTNGITNTTGESYSVVLEGSGTVAALTSYYVNDDYFGGIFNNTNSNSKFTDDLGNTDTQYTLITERGWFFTVPDALNQNTNNWEINNDDGSSWGFWAASFEKSGPLYKHVATTSPWVAGTEVSASDVTTNYINQNVVANFSGHVLGNVVNGSTIEQIHMDSGNSFTTNIDFGTQSFTTNMAFTSSNHSFDTKLTGANGSVTAAGFSTSTIDTANLGGASVTPTTANLTGKYYGSGSIIKSVGGTFQLSDGATTASGVFKAKKQ